MSLSMPTRPMRTLATALSLTATIMVARSRNVNTFLAAQGLRDTRLRRKMMDLKAAAEGRENISTPNEMMSLLEALYRGQILNREMTDDFFKVLSTHKDSWIPRNLPEDLKIATSPARSKACATIQA